MIDVSGRSYKNGIEFATENYIVNFETTCDKTKIFLRKNKGEKIKKIRNILDKIPLIRGILEILETNKFLCIAIILEMIRDKLLVNSEYKYEADKAVLIYIILITSAIGIIYIAKKTSKNVKSIFQYHGAEHKVIYTNYKEEEITLKNCRKAPCVNDDCGAMLVCLIFFIILLEKTIVMLFEITMWESIELLIAIAVAYELFLMERNTPVLCWIFKSGYWLQEHVCTIEPTENQLKEAIVAFKLLEEAENGKISLQELEELRKGKEYDI